MTAVISLTFLYCGKSGENSNTGGNEQKSVTTTNSSTEVTAFIKDYGAFINKFCSLVDKMEQKKGLQAKLSMMSQMTNESQKLATYMNNQVIIMAKASKSQEKELSDLADKGSKCSDKMSNLIKP